MSKTITITLTDPQAAVVDSLYAPHLNIPDAEGEGEITVYEVMDDNYVRLYTIAPDGSYSYESLEDGFHRGWTAFNSDGGVIDSDIDEDSD